MRLSLRLLPRRLTASLAIILVCLLYVSSGFAADSARDRMQAFSKDLHSVTADFSQSVTSANGKAGDTSKGKLALNAPRQFRWETTSPYQQLIVADGSKVWVYDPDLEQVSVRKQSLEEAHSPLSVLTDLSLLDREFTTSEAGSRDGLQWLKLVSKAAEPQFEYAELGFGGKSLARMRFKDQLGNITEIRFSNWQRNPHLPKDTFRFVPPKGVDVIGDVTPDAETMPLKD